MARYKLTIEYDGDGFFGFQRQANGPTVQGALERAINAFSGEAVTLVCAGRTDTGVHAFGQVVHFDLAASWPVDTVRDAINAHLRPARVAVIRADPVGDDFHARFDAVMRHYLYRVICRRAPLAVEAGRAWLQTVPLDCAVMSTAAKAFVGTHDFTTFRTSQCQAKSPIKSLTSASVSERDLENGRVIECRFSARSFLHSQVRSMVGSLVEIGRGKQKATWIKELLEARDRTKCGPLAPPHGLYLVKVDYPPPEKNR